MASKKGSDDIGWQHGVMLGSRHNFKCNYCSFMGQGGGVFCLKKHLTGGRLAGYHDVHGCKMVPNEVKKLMIEHLKHVQAETTRKRVDKEMQERIIPRRERDEDIEDEVEMYAEYVHDPDVQERRARAQSRAEAWEGDQRAAHRGPKYKVGRAIAKWWHHTGLPFNVANNPYYKTAIQEVQRGGLHVQPPTVRDLAGQYLQDEVNEIKSYIDSFKKKCEKYGVTLMCDETLDPNVEDDTPSSLDSPRFPNSASHDSMTTGGGGGGDGGQGGGDGDSGQGGGGGGMAFTEEQFFRGATQDTSLGAPMRYNRRQKFRPSGHGGGSPVDSHSYDTMISDFERMSTQESVGSYGGHSYHPESTSTDYSSGYGLYNGYTATAGYLGPSPYMYPPAFSVPVPVQVFAPVEDVQMAQLNVVRPDCQVILRKRRKDKTVMGMHPSDEHPNY
ncbi:hypothetical protein Taro_018670, partial [Colocasia esculenta]|nr:hypothetical protein [Colocasia esculenta]